MDQVHKICAVQEDSSVLRQQTSMGTLISWNISKAIEANPNINLKSAMKATEQRLKQGGQDLNSLVSESPEEQYLACALLAWQQLGHSEADSLHQFVETKQNEVTDLETSTSYPEYKAMPKRRVLSPGSFISYEDSVLSKGVGSSNYDTYSLVGPVVKLPVETKIVMRLDNTPAPRPPPKKAKKAPEKDIMNKIDAACCMESACMEKLTQLDKCTTELRQRAERLARREAERVELLERAEAAWKDLELGYQRRLAMAEEKEEDMARQIKKLIEERTSYKNACTNLAQQLRERGEVAEKERAKLTEVEREVCENACMRLRVSEDAARLDADLSEKQCKASQLDRDLQFKEDQVRRNLQALESELESARCLTHEAERALHAELAALRQQIAKVSNQLLEEDADNGQIKEELALFRREKMEMIDDLDGCKVLCDAKIKGKMDTLSKKRDQLKELKERVVECQCKMPVDASIQVKRTPSLAALCKCSPEDRYMETCSCSSLRSSLLTNLLADLFGGLQSELGGCGSQMPCQLLKCLEDRHNWDKSSIVKTNLRNYFSKLLIGELDIAIATSIEKYHAKWVGASCADAARMIPDCGGPENEGWQERALERRAHKLATKLAEQLFQERADQLTAQAKDIVKNGPPPCECNHHTAAVYPVLVKQPMIGSPAPAMPATNGSGAATPAYWRKAHQDITQLRVQLADLKKDSIKKEDLKVMEENIVKLVQRATVTDDITTELVAENMDKINKRKGIHQSVNTEQSCKHNTCPRLNSIKKKQSDPIPKKGSKNLILGLQVDKPVRSYKKVGRSYAVNLCLCSAHKDTKKMLNGAKQNVGDLPYTESKKSPKAMANIISQLSNGKQNKPVTAHKTSHDSTMGRKSKTSGHPSCRSDMVCFHKPPSNTSIDKLLETLAKWQCDLSKLDKQYHTAINKQDLPSLDFDVDSRDKKECDQDVNYNTPCKVSKNMSALPYTSNVIVANVSKSVGAPCEIQIATESEYMGAVNLDCTGSSYRERGTDDTSKINNCIHSKHCQSKKSSDKINDPELLKNIMDQNLNVVVIKEDSKSQLDIGSNKNKAGSDIGLINDSPTFAGDCQYCIKFLGVTLTNANPKNDSSKVEKPSKNEHSIILSKKNNRTDKYPEVWSKNDNSLTKDKRNMQAPRCNCSVKYDDVQNLINDVVTKQHGDYNKNVDKSMDTQSFENKLGVEGCVCCDSKLDESKELEVNAFHLLEEHLREKLEQFRLSNCKASCIRPEEEERLFSAILQRVKQLIIENTTELTCKCAPKELMEGSWNRAYMLLEEYLKIKFQRVQCLCHSSDDTNSQKFPNVLEKVCTLIDNDFKRLKKLCKCNNEEFKNRFKLKSEIPEKDVSNIKSSNFEEVNQYDFFKENFQTETVDKEISNNSIILTQNMSSQMSPERDMSTKSCDAMQVNIENVKCCKITEINYDGGFCTHSTKITKSYMELFGANDVFVNQCFNLPKDETENLESKNAMNIEHGHVTYPSDTTTKNQVGKIIEETTKNTPYIGYTVDCSCNGMLGTCTCTKSLITGNNDNINSIWNTLTSNKLRRNDLSYIMDAVPNKNVNQNEENGTDTVDFDYAQAERKTTCDSKIEAEYFDEIILKKSNERVNKHFLSTTTSGDDLYISPDFNSEPIEWSECRDQSDHVKQANQNVVLNEDTCDGSLYYPVQNLVNRGKSTGILKSDPINLPSSFSSHCDCNMVPLCHVKMLVENIENKLIQSKCTCDSLCTKICPVHSKIH